MEFYLVEAKDRIAKKKDTVFNVYNSNYGEWVSNVCSPVNMCALQLI